jgi:hypothetical protein
MLRSFLVRGQVRRFGFSVEWASGGCLPQKGDPQSGVCLFLAC